jgi:hypothetical protein
MFADRRLISAFSDLDISKLGVPIGEELEFPAYRDSSNATVISKCGRVIIMDFVCLLD